eukprot:6031040-Amphidinium_carterae.1
MQPKGGQSCFRSFGTVTRTNLSAHAAQVFGESALVKAVHVGGWRVRTRQSCTVLKRTVNCVRTSGAKAETNLLQCDCHTIDDLSIQPKLYRGPLPSHYGICSVSWVIRVLAMWAWKVGPTVLPVSACEFSKQLCDPINRKNCGPTPQSAAIKPPLARIGPSM